MNSARFGGLFLAVLLPIRFPTAVLGSVSVRTALMLLGFQTTEPLPFRQRVGGSPATRAAGRAPVRPLRRLDRCGSISARDGHRRLTEPMHAGSGLCAPAQHG